MCRIDTDRVIEEEEDSFSVYVALASNSHQDGLLPDMLQLLEWCSVGGLSIVSASDASIVYFRSWISIIELSLPIKSITWCILLDWEWIVVLRSVVHARKAKS